MPSATVLLLCAVAAINAATFVLYGIDKWKARHGRWRISEATLLLFALFGGSIGAALAMHLFRHKTQHKKFRFGIPAIFLLQIALLYALFASSLPSIFS